MFKYIAKKLFSSSNDRLLRSLQPTLTKINQLGDIIKPLSDQQLKLKTEEFREMLERGSTLDDILPEAFAVVREAASRVLGERHFDVQLLGGMILHKGMVAEMKTGEGKTLVATLPVYLNALSGHGVHVVTVNDYLATRDAAWMGALYKFLGLTVGTITGSISEDMRKESYLADITYCTNNELGFDYLRDNLKFTKEKMVQRGFNYAIIDEVDSILIDESRTPLIISGSTEDNSALYYKVNELIPKLVSVDYEVDEKNKNCMLTEHGHQSVEEMLKKAKLINPNTSLYDIENMELVHHVNQALKAHHMFKKEVDYIVKNDAVMIIDEFTGRVLDGRRYSDGLHQAIEAKENVRIQNENQTLASITFQNYFRMYPKIAGMTGTAMNEAAEFQDIYKLQVVSIPTHLEIKRRDEEDIIYKTAHEKYKAIVEEIARVSSEGQPILVGTISIEKSEHLSNLLHKRKIKHSVLNAKYHQQEAEIIAQAGRPHAVTIATNMAGRGTDIMLGGNPKMLYKAASEHYKGDLEALEKKIHEQVELDKKKVLELGGLYVLGTERHESRRIDDQLRGRSGRQGDPGITRFYISLEDDLMRIFGSDKISTVLTKFGLKDGEAIIHPWISRSIGKAQQKVESRNYEIRKTLLKFDNVMNEQRSVIYAQRFTLMDSETILEILSDIRKEVNREMVERYVPQKSLPEEWNLAQLEKEMFGLYGLHIDLQAFGKQEDVTELEIFEYVDKETGTVYEEKIKEYGPEMMTTAVRTVMLNTLDQLWKEHLHRLDHLRTGINLRAYAQKDPLHEYQMEAFELFKSMLDTYSVLSVQRLAHIEISTERVDGGTLSLDGKPSSQSLETDGEVNTSNSKMVNQRVPRNSQCPCGSGKKYKHCHGLQGFSSVGSTKRDGE
ncbi:preprotein translocase subunit SecA [Rickettsiales endosymbiont of Peranema trichophorum]|uniref:preprotein translocase subunit SecA n=1 Tax=Rickettsiales endosymbiont of Peranema trichophorum TaxID=2486577 RepID=UPI001022B7B2|nr:preprotein translocase subunit SecA [Rickettsiales endosymbiont of Peranema trichophorum]RZI47681.1 preprotein translocase subunit SecA [Rickettsiales endosymbiont of Peranema trichophorum]